jgi:acyl-CoA synthetase (AMP-forming)/AMP-acid ligase II
VSANPDELDTTVSVLAAVASSDPDHPAVVGPDGSATYGELADRAARLGARLAAAGVRRGDRVGLLLPNGCRWLVGMLGIHAAGASVVPLSTFARGRELGDQLARSQATVVLAQERIFGHDFGREIADREEPVRLFTWDPRSACPDELPECQVADPIGRLGAAHVEAGDEALLLFTSGSTSIPKGVRHAHGPLVRNGRAVGDRHHIDRRDRLWCASPLFFVFGCGNAVPNVLTHGATLCVQDRFDPHAAAAFIEEQRCTVFYGLAPITRAIVASGAHREHDISSLRTGTTSFTSEDRRIAIEELGIQQICSAYGLTEALGHSTMTDADDAPATRMTTEGRVLPTQEVRVVNETGGLGEPGQVGEIQLRGAVTIGYVDDAHAVDAFTPDGWFRTGDLGFLDDDQRLHFVGRSTDMIKTRGFSVAPAEVEQVLAEHPDVDQAFVFGVHAAHADEEVGCVLVSERTDGDELIAEVRTWARDRLSTYKLPRQCWVCRTDDLPQTTTGKVSKRLLRDQVTATDEV